MADRRRRQHLSPLQYNPLKPLVVHLDAKCKSSSSNCCVDQPLQHPQSDTEEPRQDECERRTLTRFYAQPFQSGASLPLGIFFLYSFLPSFLFFLPFEIHSDTCNNEFIAPVPANKLFPGRCITWNLYGRFFTRIGQSRPVRVGPPLRWPRSGHDVTAHAQTVRAVQQGAAT